MHFRNFLNRYFANFRKLSATIPTPKVFPPEINPGYATAETENLVEKWSYFSDLEDGTLLEETLGRWDRKMVKKSIFY